MSSQVGYIQDYKYLSVETIEKKNKEKSVGMFEEKISTTETKTRTISYLDDTARSIKKSRVINEVGTLVIRNANFARNTKTLDGLYRN